MAEKWQIPFYALTFLLHTLNQMFITCIPHDKPLKAFKKLTGFGFKGVDG